jgi:hypothetical protein
MRIAKRKCFWWVRRMVGGCAGTWWGCGKLPRFRIFRIKFTFIRRIKCVVLRRAFKKSLKKLVKKVRKAVRRIRIKIYRFLKSVILTKRSKRIIFKRIHKILK